MLRGRSMTLKSLLSPDAWRERVVEQVWQRAPGPELEPVMLKWPVDPRVLADVEVRWPGKYAWEPRRILGDQVRAGFSRWVRVVDADLPQPFQGAFNVEFVRGGRVSKVVIETSDYAPLNEEAYAWADLHFKMEFAREGYGPRDHLLPGSYVNNDAVIYRYLARLRQLRDEAPPLYEVHGRFGLSLEKRRPALEVLRNARRFSWYGGEGKVRYRAFLEEVARSRVVIDLPSMSSMTFRLMDYLAIGCCIVGPPHTCQLLAPFEDGVHVAYCRPDYSDLEDVCAYYLEHDEERLALIRNSRRFFDDNVHRDQVATYYLHHCLERLP